MLILKECCNATHINKIQVKYIYLVYGDNSIYLKHEGNLVKGFSNIMLIKVNSA